MHILFFLLIVPILIILVLFLTLGLSAYVKIMQLWYKLTGKQPKNPFGAFGGSFSSNGGNRQGSGPFSSTQRGNGPFGGSQQSSSYSNNSQNNNSHRTSYSYTTNANGQKKIFSQNEGEYVDFEIVE